MEVLTFKCNAVKVLLLKFLKLVFASKKIESICLKLLNMFLFGSLILTKRALSKPNC